MNQIPPPDPDAIAQMAVAIRRHMGAQALDFARSQLAVAEPDMTAVWAAIVAHLDSAA